jgi:hypothetical protein
MRHTVGFAVILTLALGARTHTARGAEIVDTDHWMIQCIINGIDGDFSIAESRYSAQGGCSVFLDYNRNYPNPQSGTSTFDNQKLAYQFLWSGVGSYNPETKNTAEKITIGYACGPSYTDPGRFPRCSSPPQVDAPLGNSVLAHITSRMACTQDPWREPSGACGSVHSDIDGDRGEKNEPSGPGIYEQGLNPIRLVPRTSMISVQQRAALNKQYSDYLADLQRKGQVIRQTPSQQTIVSQAFFPSISSPTKGQNFVAQNPIPIKLAPPQGWSPTSYMVNVEINGYSCNIPVGAAEAESAAGYTGFGAGKPPCYLAIPGSYRLRAQIDSPNQSGWSDWIEFRVLLPRVNAPAGIK